MIQVNTNYRIKAHQYGGWVLETRSEGKTKEGDPKDSWSVRYYPTFKLCAKSIMEAEAKDCETLEQVLEKMDNTVSEIEKLIHKTEDNS